MRTRSVARPLALLVALAPAVSACSGAPPPAAPTAAAEPAAPGAASPTPPADAPEAAPAATPAPAAEPPSARVTAVAPSKESAPYSRAKIEFKNPGPKPCRFVRYKLLWGTATKEVELENFTVPAGGTSERWLKVNPGDGDLQALSTDARVEVKAECGP